MDRDGGNVTALTANSYQDFCARMAPRKLGVEVTEATVVIPDSSSFADSTVQDYYGRRPRRRGTDRDRPGLGLRLHH